MCYFYLANCFRMSEQSCSTTRRHFDTNFFSFSYRPMLGATWLCLCFIMVNRVIGEEEVEMIPSGCCDWPSCYDTRTQVCHLTLIDLMIPLFKLCLDACQKVWIQCPSKLVLLSCYSRFLPKDFNRYSIQWLKVVASNYFIIRFMSPFGALPVQCFPDALQHLDLIQEKGITGTGEQVGEFLTLK